MPRYRTEEKPARTNKISVFALIFPLFFVLYAEGIFAYFSGSSLNAYKILFALAAGCIAVALSRLTPWRILNYVLQTAWLLLCVGLQLLLFVVSGFTQDYTRFNLYFAVDIALTLSFVALLPLALREVAEK